VSGADDETPTEPETPYTASLSQGSQVVKAAVCKTVYRWFDSIPWDHSDV
jgi:hypothetical protein